ncbi:MAG TPA: hypothetical protein PLR11_00665 [Candidatus Paceibacterota bacterium]|nr:hypothetical protein [Candidatus Paceibacterota bacterium]
MKILAVWERLADALQREWVDKSRKGLVEGVQVDRERKQLKAQCIISSQNEVVPVVRMDKRPDWFRISIRVPSWRKIVAVMEDRVLYPIEKEGYKLLFFRNGTVVEFGKGLLSATYYAVRTEGSKFFLVESSRFELQIPRFIETREGIRQFLSENRIPADLLEPALELIQKQKKDFSNPVWKQALEKSKIQPSQKVEAPKKEVRPVVEPQRQPQKEVPIEVPMETFDEAPAKPCRSPKKRERDEKPRRPRPQQKDANQEIRRVKGLSLKDLEEN